MAKMRSPDGSVEVEVHPGVVEQMGRDGWTKVDQAPKPKTTAEPARVGSGTRKRQDRMLRPPSKRDA